MDDDGPLYVFKITAGMENILPFHTTWGTGGDEHLSFCIKHLR